MIFRRALEGAVKWALRLFRLDELTAGLYFILTSFCGASAKSPGRPNRSPIQNSIGTIENKKGDLGIQQTVSMEWILYGEYVVNEQTER